VPLYSYTCESCGKSFEILQKSPDSGLPICPSCGGKKTVRLLSMPAPPVVRDNAAGGCCGSRNGCDSPRRCCEKRP
jgi:putative FmdB family regulatory protein